MSGHCYSCATGFSLFKKELGCKNCGFAFCKHCLSNKAPVPKLNNENHRVCLACYNVLTGKTQPKPPGKLSPPQALKKRLAALDDPTVARPLPSSVGVPRPKAPHTNKYTNPADQDIAQRLGNLKKDRGPQKEVPSQKEMEQRLAKLKESDAPPPPSTTEMAERLAKLKGQDPSTANKPHVFAVDRRLPTQQVDDLLEEICAEVEIDSHQIDIATDVQSRLDAYKGATPSEPKARGPVPVLPRGEGEGGAEEDEGNYQAMQKLVEEVADELALDAQRAIQGLQKDKEIWARLQGLKDGRKGDKEAKKEGEDEEAGSSSKGKEKEEKKQEVITGTPVMLAEGKHKEEEEESEGDEEAAKELIRKLLIENELEEQENRALIGDTKSEENVAAGENEEEEFPWCILCNEDASLRCMGCDGDLYCNTCYRKGHDRFELQDHKTKAYKPPKNAKS